MASGHFRLIANFSMKNTAFPESTMPSTEALITFPLLDVYMLRIVFRVDSNDRRRILAQVIHRVRLTVRQMIDDIMWQ
jgi:hypothetical protein